MKYILSFYFFISTTILFLTFCTNVKLPYVKNFKDLDVDVNMPNIIQKNKTTTLKPKFVVGNWPLGVANEELYYTISTPLTVTNDHDFEANNYSLLNDSFRIISTTLGEFPLQIEIRYKQDDDLALSKTFNILVRDNEPQQDLDISAELEDNLFYEVAKSIPFSYSDNVPNIYFKVTSNKSHEIRKSDNTLVTENNRIAFGDNSFLYTGLELGEHQILITAYSSIDDRIISVSPTIIRNCIKPNLIIATPFTYAQLNKLTNSPDSIVFRVYSLTPVTQSGAHYNVSREQISDPTFSFDLSDRHNPLERSSSADVANYEGKVKFNPISEEQRANARKVVASSKYSANARITPADVTSDNANIPVGELPYIAQSYEYALIIVPITTLSKVGTTKFTIEARTNEATAQSVEDAINVVEGNFTFEVSATTSSLEPQYNETINDITLSLSSNDIEFKNKARLYLYAYTDNTIDKSVDIKYRGQSITMSEDIPFFSDTLKNKTFPKEILARLQLTNLSDDPYTIHFKIQTSSLQTEVVDLRIEPIATTIDWSNMVWKSKVGTQELLDNNRAGNNSYWDGFRIHYSTNNSNIRTEYSLANLDGFNYSYDGLFQTYNYNDKYIYDDFVNYSLAGRLIDGMNSIGDHRFRFYVYRATDGKLLDSQSYTLTIVNDLLEIEFINSQFVRYFNSNRGTEAFGTAVLEGETTFKPNGLAVKLQYEGDEVMNLLVAGRRIDSGNFLDIARGDFADFMLTELPLQYRTNNTAGTMRNVRLVFKQDRRNNGTIISVYDTLKFGDFEAMYTPATITNVSFVSNVNNKQVNSNVIEITGLNANSSSSFDVFVDGLNYGNFTPANRLTLNRAVSFNNREVEQGDEYIDNTGRRTCNENYRRINYYYRDDYYRNYNSSPKTIRIVDNLGIEIYNSTDRITEPRQKSDVRTQTRVVVATTPSAACGAQLARLANVTAQYTESQTSNNPRQFYSYQYALDGAASNNSSCGLDGDIRYTSYTAVNTPSGKPPQVTMGNCLYITSYTYDRFNVPNKREATWYDNISKKDLSRIYFTIIVNHSDLSKGFTIRYKNKVYAPILSGSSNGGQRYYIEIPQGTESRQNVDFGASGSAYPSYPDDWLNPNDLTIESDF